MNAADPLSFEPGRQFDRYTIEALVGEGGMGRIYRAFDTRLHRRVALKVLDPTVSGEGRDAVIASLREARAAAAIAHPNATATFDADELAGISFIVMEFVPGISLRRLIGDTAVPLQVRIRWLVDVAGALSAAHQVGIIHRDVKPENVMVRDDGIVKVLDFGVARRTGLSDANASDKVEMATPNTGSRLVGTPAYMAPEQIRGEPIDGRADQFAWGVLGYELLTGHLPWKTAKDFLGYLAAVMIEIAEPPRGAVPEIPAEVNAAIMRALSKMADARFPSMAAAAAELAPHARTELTAMTAGGAMATSAVRPSAPSPVPEPGTEATVSVPFFPHFDDHALGHDGGAPLGVPRSGPFGSAPPAPAPPNPPVAPTLEATERVSPVPLPVPAPPASIPGAARSRPSVEVTRDSGARRSRPTPEPPFEAPSRRIRDSIVDPPTDPGSFGSRSSQPGSIPGAPPSVDSSPSLRARGLAGTLGSPDRRSPQAAVHPKLPLRDPDFGAAVDLDAHVRLLPPDASCKGMFFMDVLARASRFAPSLDIHKAAGIPERRYLPFRDYPMADGLRLTSAAARVLFPRHGIGEGLRRVGRTAFETILGTHVGRSLFGVLADEIDSIFMRSPKAYKLLLNFGELSAEKTDFRTYLFRVKGFPAFLETYQVGVIEGVVAHCKERSQIQIALDDLACGAVEVRLL
jgi:serine/threonine-protein kinase